MKGNAVKLDIPIVYTCECLCFDGVGALGRVYILYHHFCCRRIDILVDQLDSEGIWVRSI